MVKLYVEGGGDTTALKAECRAGFSAFITSAGITVRPRIVACGSRSNAFESYCTAIANGEAAMLLVDSEAPVAAQAQPEEPSTWQPWQHLKNHQEDGWNKPPNAVDTDCHLMVQCMENWLLADRVALQKFFGQGFQDGPLPVISTPIEQIAKITAYGALAQASQACKTKAQYGKGAHSFKLLALVNPDKVMAAAPWAERFVTELKKKMHG